MKVNMGSTLSFSNLLSYLLKPWHNQYFSSPRLTILGNALAKFLPASEDLVGLDIGCGPGTIAKEIVTLRPRITFAGVDVIERLDAQTRNLIAYQNYDGQHLPYPDKLYSFSMLVDVLHHTNNPKQLLAEAVRVTQDFILIKDHISQSHLDKSILSIMDWVGNKSYGVHLPYNYLSNEQWRCLFNDLNLTLEEIQENLELYKPPLSFIFGGKLQFIAKLKVKK